MRLFARWFLYLALDCINLGCVENDIWKLRSKINRANKNRFRVLFFLRLKRYERWMNAHMSYIPYNTVIAEMPIFPHGIKDIFISEGAQIGKGAVFFQQITIGSNTIDGSKGYGSPIIGDNVYVGAGAKIIGGVHIGNNVRIGANAIIVMDVPDNATVVSDRSRIICHTKIQDNTYHQR